MAVRKSDLYSSLWASCNELRGGMDASQYKDYVLFMLFIKYVSDKYGASKDFEPPIVIPKGASFHDMTRLKGNPGIGDLINTQVVQPLVDANISMLARTDFPDFNDPNKLGDGNDCVQRLTNLITIFENPELDFARNRAENDDILGDAYEYLMRHFATESGKSKGQFYTPSEVSSVIAKVIGITLKNTSAKTTVYDPTCGSGSLLLKVAAEAGRPITLEGQEKDVTTAGLARMNMILHGFPTARVVEGNTLTTPKFIENGRLRTYDYVVANPPFSDKSWSTGFVYDEKGAILDEYRRFVWGAPPKKQGDYAYVMHILRSMKRNGKAACILPHGVLFRGNAEAELRKGLIESGYLKCVIGLPSNLFYGTGIPACILVFDKENAESRRGIFMIDASNGFRKDGAKNRLRDQDTHRIVDTFRQHMDVRGYARLVPFDEIISINDFNLSLSRYIDSLDLEIIHDIEAHFRGGIPKGDIDALDDWWRNMPKLRRRLFKKIRPGYFALARPAADLKAIINDHLEFKEFTDSAIRDFKKWRNRTNKIFRSFGPNDEDRSIRELVEMTSDDLLNTFQRIPIIDSYKVYQQFMDYCTNTLRDDCYLIAADGWTIGAKPRENGRRKRKTGKMERPGVEGYVIDGKRYTSELIPHRLVVERYYPSEKEEIDLLDSRIEELESNLSRMVEDGAVEGGWLSEIVELEDEDIKITKNSLNARLIEIESNPSSEVVDEIKKIREYNELSRLLDVEKKNRTKANDTLYWMVHEKYTMLTEDEIKTLIISDKWLGTVTEHVTDEITRVAHTLLDRILGSRLVNLATSSS